MFDLLEYMLMTVSHQDLLIVGRRAALVKHLLGVRPEKCSYMPGAQVATVFLFIKFIILALPLQLPPFCCSLLGSQQALLSLSPPLMVCAFLIFSPVKLSNLFPGRFKPNRAYTHDAKRYLGVSFWCKRSDR